MKPNLGATTLAIVGVVFLLLSFANVSMFQFATTTGGSGGGGTSSTSSSWTLAGSVQVTTSSVTAGNSVELLIEITSYSSSSVMSSSTIHYLINGNQIGERSVSGIGTFMYLWTPQTTGSFTFTGTYVNSYDGSTGGTTTASFSGSIGITVNAGAPTIQSVSASPNPIFAGNYTTFSATVNWHGSVGTLRWSVSPGTSVTGGSGNKYLFIDAGTYTVTATATNSVGSATDSFGMTVKAQPVAPPPVIRGAGSFYLETPSGSYVQITSQTNIVFQFANYPATLNVLYVENNGTTTNFTNAYIQLNTNTPITLTNATTYKGDLAFGGQLILSSSGTYTITGGLNGNGTIGAFQLFSIAGTMNNQNTTVTTVPSFNIPDLGLAIVMFGLAGYVFWRKH